MRAPTGSLGVGSLRSPAISSATRDLAQYPIMQRTKKSVIVTPQTWPIRFQIDNPDAWKPPDAWRCSPMNDPMLPTVRDRRQGAEENTDANSMTMDLPAMQRELRKMAAANPQIMLIRLTEKWGCTPDATFCKELEMEKKRWMLSALYNLDKPREDEDLEHRQERLAGDSRILALFETKGELISDDRPARRLFIGSCRPNFDTSNDVLSGSSSYEHSDNTSCSLNTLQCSVP